MTRRKQDQESNRTWLHRGFPVDGGSQRYRRPDARILEDVCERLSQRSQIDASQMEIEVHEGEVTLQGMVSSHQMLHLAEDIAETVAGVQNVHNHLHIRDLSTKYPAGRNARNLGHRAAG